MKKLMLAGIVAVAALTLTACSAGTPDVNGNWGATGKQTRGEPALSLSEDGKAHGNDGCNTMNGSFTVEQGTVTFAPFATTMMACDGVDQWLSTAASATVSGDTMTFLDADGKEIGTLDRAK